MKIFRGFLNKSEVDFFFPNGPSEESIKSSEYFVSQTMVEDLTTRVNTCRVDIAESQTNKKNAI